MNQHIIMNKLEVILPNVQNFKNTVNKLIKKFYVVGKVG